MQPAKLTGEHLWSQWIGEELKKIGAARMRLSSQLLDDPTTFTWESRTCDLTAKVVCKRCNETWMSDLESNHAKPSIGKMILATAPVTLTRAQIISISAFAFKCAVIGDHMNRKRLPFFSPESRRRFACSLTIPPAIYVWIGCISGDDPIHGLFKVQYGITPPRTPNGFRLYTFTWGIGRFFVQLLAWHWMRGRLRRTLVPSITQNEFWNPYSIPIWPNPPLSVQWPPAGHLNNHQMTTFSNRWKHIIDFPASRL
jgi:hypothetical protein